MYQSVEEARAKHPSGVKGQSDKEARQFGGLFQKDPIKKSNDSKVLLKKKSGNKTFLRLFKGFFETLKNQNL